MNKGIGYVLGAYIFWGLHPVYWKLLKHVPSQEILAHRIFWSLFFFLILISWRKGWRDLYGKIKESRNKALIIIPAFLIGSNWGVYVWAVNSGHVIETSLGYFICPLVQVFLGVVFLKENLSRLQWLAVAIAAFGVLLTTILMGTPPWISLFLAVTWGFYCLLRKKSPLDSAQGLLFETGLLSVPAIIYLIFISFTGTSNFSSGIATTLLLAGTGIISGLPLAIFIAGSRIINLSFAGVLQYIYPTLIFLTGYFVFNEPLNMAKLTGFIFIWIALLIYSLSNFIPAVITEPIPDAD